MLELLVVDTVRLLYCTVISGLQRMSLLEFCSQRSTAVISWWEVAGGKCEEDRILCSKGIGVLMEELWYASWFMVSCGFANSVKHVS